MPDHVFRGIPLRGLAVSEGVRSRIKAMGEGSTKFSSAQRGSDDRDPRGGTSPSAAAFYELVTAYSLCADPVEREQIDADVWSRYGVTGIAMITDMEGFSTTTRSLGICHFLGMIERARRVVAPVVAANQGVLLKCEADNCYAFFHTTDDALRASIDLAAGIAEINGGHKGIGEIQVSTGIDYGRLLLVGEHDFYGDPVNTASKLGEDLAGGGETLVTNRALDQTEGLPGACSEQRTTRISGIDIQYKRFGAA